MNKLYCKSFGCITNYILVSDWYNLKCVLCGLKMYYKYHWCPVHYKLLSSVQYILHYGNQYSLQIVVWWLVYITNYSLVTSAKLYYI